MAFKRDFQRAFDIPVGLHVAAELQVCLSLRFV